MDILKEVRRYFKEAGINNPVDNFGDFVRQKLDEYGIQDIYDEAYYWAGGWKNFRILFKALFGYKVRGAGNFPEFGPAVLVPNHQSEFDPFLAGSALHRKVSWVSKHENFQMPIFRTIITPFGTIPLKRGESDKKALRKIDAVLESGGCIGIFPEGTRSPDGSLSHFHKGAAIIAMKNMVPYVPLAIIGAHKALPKGTSVFKMKPSPIEIRIGKPVFIDPTIPINVETARAITLDMRRRVQALIDGKEVPSQAYIQYDEKEDVFSGFYYPTEVEEELAELSIS